MSARRCTQSSGSSEFTDPPPANGECPELSLRPPSKFSRAVTARQAAGGQLTCVGTADRVRADEGVHTPVVALSSIHHRPTTRRKIQPGRLRNDAGTPAQPRRAAPVAGSPPPIDFRVVRFTIAETLISYDRTPWILSVRYPYPFVQSSGVRGADAIRTALAVAPCCASSRPRS
jgi:hypothetical protein